MRIFTTFDNGNFIVLSNGLERIPSMVVSTFCKNGLSFIITLFAVQIASNATNLPDKYRLQKLCNSWNSILF